MTVGTYVERGRHRHAQAHEAPSTADRIVLEAVFFVGVSPLHYGHLIESSTFRLQWISSRWWAQRLSRRSRWSPRPDRRHTASESITCPASQPRFDDGTFGGLSEPRVEHARRCPEERPADAGSNIGSVLRSVPSRSPDLAVSRPTAEVRHAPTARGVPRQARRRTTLRTLDFQCPAKRNSRCNSDRDRHTGAQNANTKEQ
jgi:hypothetical protein